MWSYLNSLPTAIASAKDGSKPMRPAALIPERASSFSVSIAIRLRKASSRILNSVMDENTLLGLVAWAIFLALLGVVLVFISLAPVWMVIVIAALSIPFIFGACKE